MTLRECGSRHRMREMEDCGYSVNTTDCTLVISKRLRQRMFLQASRSSLRIMYDRALAKRARSRSSARGGTFRFFVRTSQLISYSADCWQCGQFSVAIFLSGRSSKKSRSSMGRSSLSGSSTAYYSCAPSRTELLHTPDQPNAIHSFKDPDSVTLS